MNYSGAIRTFIVDNFLFGEEEKLQNDVSFFDSGVVDSTGVLEIADFIEKKYQVTIDDEELIPENFSSVNTIDGYLNKKINKAAS